MKKYFIVLLLIIFSGWVLMYCLPPLAKVTVRVIDEQNKPVENADVNIMFSGRGLVKDNSIGATNKGGTFSATRFLTTNQLYASAVKNGFYPSIATQSFFIKKFIFAFPWNKILTLQLRPVVNPVPMYVRNNTFLFPALNKNLGFDLMKADWLPPYGNGSHADFILRVDRVYKDIDNFDATLTMTFSNSYDGIQMIKDDGETNYLTGSRYRLPRNAPVDGYQPTFVKRVSAGVYGTRKAKDDVSNYIFRVRSEYENGKLKRAMYGKILRDIRFGPTGDNGGFEMHYYLNPDYTRNLEFDPKRNLFTNLPLTEGVALP